MKRDFCRDEEYKHAFQASGAPDLRPFSYLKYPVHETLTTDHY